MNKLSELTNMWEVSCSPETLFEFEVEFTISAGTRLLGNQEKQEVYRFWPC